MLEVILANRLSSLYILKIKIDALFSFHNTTCIIAETYIYHSFDSLMSMVTYKQQNPKYITYIYFFITCLNFIIMMWLYIILFVTFTKTLPTMSGSATVIIPEETKISQFDQVLEI